MGHDRAEITAPGNLLGALEQAAAILEVDVWCRWVSDTPFAALASHHVSQRELHKVGEYAGLLLDSANLHEAHKRVAIALRLLGEVAIGRGDLAEAGAHLQAALEELADHPAPFVEWKIYSLLGRLRLNAGDGGENEAVDRATHVVRTIAANIEEADLRESFLGEPSVKTLFSRREGAIAGKCQESHDQFFGKDA